MKIHEFYAKYANTPLTNRFVWLDFIKHSTLTLHGIYEQLKNIDEITRPLDIKREELLEIAEKSNLLTAPSTREKI